MGGMQEVPLSPVVMPWVKGLGGVLPSASVQIAALRLLKNGQAKSQPACQNAS